MGWRKSPTCFSDRLTSPNSISSNFCHVLKDVAEDAVSVNLCEKLDSITVGGELPPAVKAAILLLVGNLYANREPVAYTSVNKVPYTFEYLLSLYKNYSTKQ